MPTNVELSIIIINYNTFELTRQCINSIVKETININYEIIVVDNASTERAPQDFSTILSSVVVIPNKNNVGFGIANNIGMQHAKGNYFLLLNSDTIIIDNCIGQALAHLKNVTDIGLLGCKELNEHGVSSMPASFYFIIPTIINYIFENPIQQLISSKLKLANTKEIIENKYVKNLSGAFMLLKKEVFETTKGFDPDFFMYCEEIEWCIRINKKYKIFYLADTKFIHLKGRSGVKPVMLKQMYLSQGLFWYKLGYFKYLAFLLITYLIHLPALFILTILAFKPLSKNSFFKKIQIYTQLCPYYLFNITSFKNKYGGRTNYLKLKELL